MSFASPPWGEGEIKNFQSSGKKMKIKGRREEKREKRGKKGKKRGKKGRKGEKREEKGKTGDKRGLIGG